MHDLTELKNILLDKLHEYAADGRLTTNTLDVVHKLTDTVKNLDKIEMLESDGGYSHRYEPERYRSRYSGDRRYVTYAHDTDARDKMLTQIDSMIAEAGTEKEREALRRCMSALRDV